VPLTGLGPAVTDERWNQGTFSSERVAMTQEPADLSVLSRGGSDRGQTAGRSADQVPRPRSRWKTRIALPGAILTATGVTLLYASGEALWPATDVRVVPVLVKTGVAGGGSVTVQAPGWVESDPFPSAVSALADGVAKEVLVLEGQPVKAGQVVARLIDDDARLSLASVEAALAEREAELLVAQAVLKAAQRDWDHPVELTRQLVTAQAELAEKRAELKRWPSELTAAKALSVELEAEFKRVGRLHRNEMANDIEFIRAEQRHEAQKAEVEATKLRKAIIEAQIRRIEAEIVAARDNLRLRIPETRALEEARAAVARHKAAVEGARAARDEAKLRLDRMEVRSPVDGIVMTRLAEPGSKMMLNADNPRSAHIIRLYDPNALQVRVDVPLVDAAKVGVGQQAEVVVDVLPDRVFKGVVSRIVHEADVQKNTLQVKVAIEDPSPELKPEMLARARFLAVAKDGPEKQAERVFAPESLLRRLAGGEVRVWLADQARNVAVSRVVVAGRGRIGGWIEIEDGLRPGDRLIADAPDDMQDGQRVRILGERSSAP